MKNQQKPGPWWELTDTCSITLLECLVFNESLAEVSQVREFDRTGCSHGTQLPCCLYAHYGRQGACVNIAGEGEEEKEEEIKEEEEEKEEGVPQHAVSTSSLLQSSLERG